MIPGSVFTEEFGIASANDPADLCAPKHFELQGFLENISAFHMAFYFSSPYNQLGKRLYRALTPAAHLPRNCRERSVPGTLSMNSSISFLFFYTGLLYGTLAANIILFEPATLI